MDTLRAAFEHGVNWPPAAQTMLGGQWFGHLIFVLSGWYSHRNWSSRQYYPTIEAPAVMEQPVDITRIVTGSRDNVIRLYDAAM